MDARLERIGRLAAVARGLEREGAYNGAKLVRVALQRELVHFAEQESAVGGEAAAAAIDSLVEDLGAHLPPALLPYLREVGPAVTAGRTIPLDAAPRARVCRVCGDVFLGDAVPPACPTCEAPAISFHEELPVWYLEPADRGAILAALAAGPRHLDAALAGHPDGDLRQAPAAGAWSAAQTLEHLLFAEELFATRIDRLLTEEEPDLAAAAVWADTPASDEGTAETGETATALARRIRELRHAAVDRLAALDDADWGRAGCHPEWGRVTVLSQAAYFARHEASHLAQLVAAADGRVPGERRR